MQITPTELDSGPFRQLIDYPHLSYSESHIWSQFIQQNPDAFDLVSYDVPVGVTPAMPRGAASVRERKMIRQSYSKRIDVVALKGRQIYVIEIKPRAGYTAFGQALVYTACFNTTYSPDPQAIPAILTEHLDQDIAKPCSDHKIHIFYPSKLT